MNVRVVGNISAAVSGRTAIELLAHRDADEIVVTLAPHVAAERAARLSSAGWAVELRASEDEVA
jgi:hypothetical protein